MIHSVVCLTYERYFEELFGKKLKNFDDFFTGFDVVEFDKFLNPEEGKSLAEFIEEKYGKEAKFMIKNFIKNNFFDLKTPVFIINGDYKFKNELIKKCKNYNVEYKLLKEEI